jgi:hypothetical protein
MCDNWLQFENICIEQPESTMHDFTFAELGKPGNCMAVDLPENCLDIAWKAFAPSKVRS